jgi:hypothetical protein
MPFYEYEYIVQNLIDILKEKQEAEEKTQKGAQQDMSISSVMKDASKYLPSGMKSGTPSIPNMSNLSNFPGIPSSLKI